MTSINAINLNDSGMMSNNNLEHACQKLPKSEISISNSSWNQITSSAKPIYIEWVDASTHGGPEWVSSEEAMEYISKETPVMRSIGWLLMNTGKSIVMTDTIKT
jgi:hypothetical protein